jgi:hypothetical protein
MSWWNEALYDTCSLVTLDAVLRDHAEARPHFPAVLAVQASLAAGHVRKETAARIAQIARLCCLPPVKELNRILSVGRLPLAFADVDRLIYAAAVYHRHHVITGDGNLTAALAKCHLRAGTLARALKELASKGVLSQPRHDQIVAGLAARNGLVAGSVTLVPTGDEDGRQPPEPAICPASRHPTPRGARTRHGFPAPAP